MNCSSLENKRYLTKKILFFLFCFFVFGLIDFNICFANTITIFPHKYLPSVFLLVDKQKQMLYVANYKNGTIKFIKREPCSTGAIKGDKTSHGDKKTPEGIYFFRKKINNPPDFLLYGNLAFPLNYPNPIDKLLHKNGDGIWLHGRGKKLVPYDTKGCIAIKNNPLKVIGNYIKLNFTPILIASKIKIRDPSPDQLKDLEKIRKIIEDWINAWKDKNDSYFKYYDKIAFSITSNTPFDKFIKQKRHYFKKYKWIDIFVPKIYILTGPYYIVSYFYEMFRCPYFKSTGIKRVYLMQKENEYKIVASEWIYSNINLDNEYLKLHTAKINSFLKKWKNAWENKDIEKFLSFYDKHATQNNLSAKESIYYHKQRLWRNIQKISVELQNINISIDPSGFKVKFLQKYRADHYQDIGIKTLIIYPYKGSYKIQKEIWRPL